MLAPFTPVDPHNADVTAALLTILADPAAHRARLDELVAQENAAKEQIAALNAMAADTRRKHTAAEATTIVLNNRKTALDTREAEIEEKSRDLDEATAKRSDAALRRRENAVTVREEAATREAERLAVLRSEYESKLAKLKELAGALG
jgi:hypothetical protein